MTAQTDFLTRGWTAFPPAPEIAAWAASAEPVAAALVAAPDAEWRCDGTWFPGVNILPNDRDGALPGGPPLAGPVVDAARAMVGEAEFAWDAGQLSVCAPGYPRQGPEETEAAARYRRVRDAAHVDGLLREPPARNRWVGERHGFILGIPLWGVEPSGASPLVVWEGSHEIMRAAFRSALAGVAPEHWASVDVTEIYQAARRDCFEICQRVEVSAPVGGAYLVHRLALHGVAPWTASEEPSGAHPGRAIAYFRPDPRPEATHSYWWLTSP